MRTFIANQSATIVMVVAVMIGLSSTLNIASSVSAMTADASTPTSSYCAGDPSNTSIPSCRATGTCPTLSDCAQGWQLHAPSSPMTNIPYGLTRQSCTHPVYCSPDADGSIHISFCYTTDERDPNRPKCSEVDSSITVPNIPLRVWCARIRSLPMPSECVTKSCGMPYSFIGLCGI